MFQDDDDEHDEHSSLSEAIWLGGCEDLGPHIRTVVSSDAEANMDGYTGFQETQFTVRVCPTNLAKGSSRLICHIYTYGVMSFIITMNNV